MQNYFPPGRVKSRVNIQNTAGKHIEEKHFIPAKNAFQFTILKALLSSDAVVKKSIVQTLQSAEGTIYMLVVDVGKDIGTNKFNRNLPTSTMTVLTDEYGNLKTAFPGLINQ